MQIGEMLRATDKRGRRYFGIGDYGRSALIAGLRLFLRLDGTARLQREGGGAGLDLLADGIQTDGPRVGFSGGAVRSVAEVILGGRLVSFAHLDAKLRSVFRYGPGHFAAGGLWVERHADGGWTLSGPRGTILSVPATGRVEYTDSRARMGAFPGAALAIHWGDGRLSAFRVDPVDGALRLLGREASSGGGGIGQPSDIRPWFASTLRGVEGVPLPIYLDGLLMDRADIPRCRLAVTSAASSANGKDYLATGIERVQVDVAKMTAAAQVVVHPAAWDGGTRAVLQLTVKAAPRNPGVAPAPKILTVGDSIVNRDANWLMNLYLTDWGYAPSFVGTIQGTTNGASSTGTGGPLGEGREGNQTEDFDYKRTSRVTPLAPGSEAAYLAKAKADQRLEIPWLRAATGSDAAQDINNGYVMDWSYYQSRFAGLLTIPTPDVFIWQAGTNNAIFSPAAGLYDTIYAADMLMYRRVLAAWPSVKIIRMLPGVARSVEKDALWKASYIPMIRAMRKAIADTANPNIVLAPTWAMAAQDVGYSLASVTADPDTGASVTTLNDATHPINAGRAELWRAAAGYVAAAVTP